MRSQVQNGTRKVGYVTTSAHLESPRPSQLTTWASGRKRSEGGTGEGTKMPVPKPAAPKKLSRPSAYAATVPRTSESVVASTVTSRLFMVQVRNADSQRSLL